MPRRFTKRLTELPKWAAFNHCGKTDRGPEMSQNRSLAGNFVLSLALLTGFPVPAAAEFFGGHDREGQVLSSRIIVTYPDGRPYTRHRHRGADARPAPAHHRYSHVRYSQRKRYYSNGR